MTANDPVTRTAGALFVQQPSDEDLHQAAVVAVGLMMQRKWPQAAPDELHNAAGDLLDQALEIGPRGAVVLVPDSLPDSSRLAHAVRSTGTNQCSKCGGPPYDGRPTEQDIEVAGQVIKALLSGVGT